MSEIILSQPVCKVNINIKSVTNEKKCLTKYQKYDIIIINDNKGGESMYNYEKGWIAIPRTITETWIWNDGKKFGKTKAFLDLMFSANFKDIDISMNGEVFTIKRGSLLTSVLKLSKRWEWDRRGVSNFLRGLKNHGEIEYERFGNGILLTISNYSEVITDGADIFFDKKNEQQSLQLNVQTDIQPDVQPDVQPNPTSKERNKEKKEERNNGIMKEGEEEGTACACEQKDEYAKSVMLTKAEYDLLKGRYGESDTKWAIEILSDYKLATGKEYLSDFYAITKWGIDAVKERKNNQLNSELDTEFELLKTEESAEEFERIMWERMTASEEC